jgi:tetratricopeptide (TPR) repeat protein
MALNGIDKGILRAAVCAAASLMVGVMLVVWLRTMDAVAGRTVQTLAVFAGSAVSGGVVGCALASFARRVTPRRDAAAAWMLSLLLLLVGGSLIAQLALAPAVTADWQRVLNALSRSTGQYGWLLARTGFLFVFVPSVWIAAAARVACGMTGPVAGGAGNGAGGPFVLLLLLGLLPAGVGYGLGAGALVPWIGPDGLTRFAALWFGALSGLALARGVWCALPFLAVVAGVALLGPEPRDAVFADGVFSRLVHRDSGFARGKPVFVRQTRHHAVTAYEDPDYRFVFALDGRPVLFGNRFHTARTLAGYIPLLLRPECGRAALFGPEAGLYLPFFLRAGVGEVSVGGIDDALLRLSVVADDHLTGGETDMKGAVRRRARLSPKQGYDLVFLAPEPAWMRGTEKAYGRGLFRRCRGALAAGGLVALHLDARALSQRRLAAVARDFAREFPDMQLWCAGAYDWLLVGGTATLQTPADKMLALFEREAVERDFTRAGILSLPEVVACMVCDGAGLVPWLERTGFETAFANACRVPRVVFGKGREGLVAPHVLEACRQKTLEWLVPGAMDVGVYQAVRDRAAQCAEARSLAARAWARTGTGEGEAGLADARAAAKLNARDPLLTQLAEGLELEGRRRIAIGEFKGGLKCYENLLSFSPGSALSHYGMGFCLRASGDNETAYLHFARAVAAAPGQTGYRMELAQVAMAIGEYAEADRQYQEILKREPDNLEAMFRYAKGLAAKDRPDKDFSRAVKLAEEVCVKTKWKNPEYAFGLADLYMDAGRVLEGMGLKRRLKDAVGRSSRQ